VAILTAIGSDLEHEADHSVYQPHQLQACRERPAVYKLAMKRNRSCACKKAHVYEGKPPSPNMAAEDKKALDEAVARVVQSPVLEEARAGARVG
jgi:hypothetical protein